MRSKETIEMWTMIVEYIENIENHVPIMITAYRKNEIGKASEMMSDLSEGLLWMNQILQITEKDHGIDTSGLQNIFAELVSSLENTDYILTADLLEHELLPSLNNIQATLKRKLFNTDNKEQSIAQTSNVKVVCDTQKTRRIALIFLEDDQSMKRYPDFFSSIDTEWEIHLFQGVTLGNYHPEYPLEYLRNLMEQNPEDIFSSLFISDNKELTIFSYRFFHGFFSDFIWIVKENDAPYFHNKINFRFHDALANFSGFAEEPFDESKEKIYVLFDEMSKQRWMEAITYDPDVYYLLRTESFVAKDVPISEQRTCYEKKYIFEGQQYYIDKNGADITTTVVEISPFDSSTKNLYHMDEMQAERFVDFLLKYGAVKGVNYVGVLTAIKEHISSARWSEIITFFEKEQTIAVEEQQMVLIYLCSLNPTYENVKKIFSVIQHPVFNIDEQKYIYWQLTSLIFNQFDSVDGEDFFVEEYKLYSTILEKAKMKFGNIMQRLSGLDTHSNRVLIVADQFLHENHAPTRRVADYAAQFIKKLNCEVMIINTSEMPKDQELLFHRYMTATTRKDIDDAQAMLVEEGSKALFYQMKNQYKNEEEVKAVVEKIRQFAPAYAFSVGASNLLADLIAPYIPTVSICCGYGIPVACNGYHAFGRKVEQEDIRIMKRVGMDTDSTIETTITFKKPSTIDMVVKKHAEEFSICIVSNRLDEEVTEKTINLCEELLAVDKKIKINFFGGFTVEITGDDWIEKIRNHSKYGERYVYEGYRHDILNAYKECDLCYNVKRNGGGSSVAQAMLMGLPILSHNFGDGAYVVGKQKCFNSDEDMVKEFKKIFHDKQYYQQAKQYSLDQSAKIFDTARMIVEFDQVVRQRIAEDK